MKTKHYFKMLLQFKVSRKITLLFFVVSFIFLSFFGTDSSSIYVGAEEYIYGCPPGSMTCQRFLSTYLGDLKSCSEEDYGKVLDDCKYYGCVGGTCTLLAWNQDAFYYPDCGVDDGSGTGKKIPDNSICEVASVYGCVKGSATCQKINSGTPEGDYLEVASCRVDTVGDIMEACKYSGCVGNACNFNLYWNQEQDYPDPCSNNDNCEAAVVYGCVKGSKTCQLITNPGTPDVDYKEVAGCTVGEIQEDCKYSGCTAVNTCDDTLFWNQTQYTACTAPAECEPQPVDCSYLDECAGDAVFHYVWVTDHCVHDPDLDEDCSGACDISPAVCVGDNVGIYSICPICDHDTNACGFLPSLTTLPCPAPQERCIGTTYCCKFGGCDCGRVTYPCPEPGNLEKMCSECNPALGATCIGTDTCGPAEMVGCDCSGNGSGNGVPGQPCYPIGATDSTTCTCGESTCVGTGETGTWSACAEHFECDTDTETCECIDDLTKPSSCDPANVNACIGVCSVAGETNPHNDCQSDVCTPVDSCGGDECPVDGNECCTSGDTRSCEPCGSQTCGTNGAWWPCPTTHNVCQSDEFGAACACAVEDGATPECTDNSECCTPGDKEDCDPCGEKTCGVDGRWGTCPTTHNVCKSDGFGGTECACAVEDGTTPECDPTVGCAYGCNTDKMCVVGGTEGLCDIANGNSDCCFEGNDHSQCIHGACVCSNEGGPGGGIGCLDDELCLKYLACEENMCVEKDVPAGTTPPDNECYFEGVACSTQAYGCEDCKCVPDGTGRSCDVANGNSDCDGITKACGTSSLCPQTQTCSNGVWTPLACGIIYAQCGVDGCECQAGSEGGSDECWFFGEDSSSCCEIWGQHGICDSASCDCTYEGCDYVNSTCTDECVDPDECTNAPPNAINLNTTSSLLCGQTTGTMFFSWTYTDAENDPETKFVFEVDDNQDFSSPEVHREILNPSGPANSQPVNVKTTAPDANCYPDECPAGTDDCFGYSCDFLTYNAPYYWRVMVSEDGQDSDWVNYSNASDPDGDSNPDTYTFIYSHPLPMVSISFSPENPGVGVLVSFTDNSVCYHDDLSPSADYCEDSNINYSWNFGDGSSVVNTKGNVSHTYSTGGDEKDASLTICDNTYSNPGVTSKCCRDEVVVPVGPQIKKNIPIWTEISPF